MRKIFALALASTVGITLFSITLFSTQAFAFKNAKEVRAFVKKNGLPSNTIKSRLGKLLSKTGHFPVIPICGSNKVPPQKISIKQSPELTPVVRHGKDAVARTIRLYDKNVRRTINATMIITDKTVFVKDMTYKATGRVELEEALPGQTFDLKTRQLKK